MKENEGGESPPPAELQVVSCGALINLYLVFYCRREEFLKTQEPLRGNAVIIIDKMLDWCNQNPGSKHLVDEVGNFSAFKH